MKRLWVAVLCLHCVAAAPSLSLLTPGQFTTELAQALRKADPHLKVEVIRDLQLKIVDAAGKEVSAYLDNWYTRYKRSPDEKAAFVRGYVSSQLELSGPGFAMRDRSRIVPIIKDRPWLAEIEKGLKARGDKTVPEYVHEDYNEELIILYAEDTPKNMRYLIPDDLAQLKLERKDLRQLACANLRRLLPKIETHSYDDGTYMLTVDGNYEASLILLEEIWNSGEIKVDGEIVVAIPSRDLLMVAGSNNREGLQRLNSEALHAVRATPYHLVPTLFVHRNGKFVVFNQP
jgi:uncharacterized protein YtpQ (UPF0354 family)